MPISDPKSLREHLQTALTLELSTIPPYLCALYSIPEGSNMVAAEVIRSVVMEEMLHMTLVANLLNAVGGTPCLDQAEYIPSYPGPLPHSDGSFSVGLLPFSPEAIETFLKIERPAKPKAPPEADRYETIGQFYEAVEEAFETLHREFGKKLFSGKSSRQVRGEHWYYGGGGEPIEVVDLESAKRAIAEIAEQGEGLDHGLFDGDDEFGEEKELAHYFRFKEIQLGRRYLDTDTPAGGPTGPELIVDWTARYPMGANPRARDYKGQPEIHALMTAFNQRYTELLLMLQEAFTGSPEQLREAVPLMYDLKYKAQALMRIPSGRADGTTVGPSFEFLPPTS